MVDRGDIFMEYVYVSWGPSHREGQFRLRTFYEKGEPAQLGIHRGGVMKREWRDVKNKFTSYALCQEWALTGEAFPQWTASLSVSPSVWGLPCSNFLSSVIFQRAPILCWGICERLATEVRNSGGNSANKARGHVKLNRDPVNREVIDKVTGEEANFQATYGNGY